MWACDSIVELAFHVCRDGVFMVNSKEMSWEELSELCPFSRCPVLYSSEHLLVDSHGSYLSKVTYSSGMGKLLKPSLKKRI